MNKLLLLTIFTLAILFFLPATAFRISFNDFAIAGNVFVPNNFKGEIHGIDMSMSGLDPAGTGHAQFTINQGKQKGYTFVFTPGYNVTKLRNKNFSKDVLLAGTGEYEAKWYIINSADNSLELVSHEYCKDLNSVVYGKKNEFLEIIRDIRIVPKIGSVFKGTCRTIKPVIVDEDGNLSFGDTKSFISGAADKEIKKFIFNNQSYSVNSLEAGMYKSDIREAPEYMDARALLWKGQQSIERDGKEIRVQNVLDDSFTGTDYIAQGDATSRMTLQDVYSGYKILDVLTNDSSISIDKFRINIHVAWTITLDDVDTHQGYVEISDTTASGGEEEKSVLNKIKAYFKKYIGRNKIKAYVDNNFIKIKTDQKIKIVNNQWQLTQNDILINTGVKVIVVKGNKGFQEVPGRTKAWVHDGAMKLE